MPALINIQTHQEVDDSLSCQLPVYWDLTHLVATGNNEALPWVVYCQTWLFIQQAGYNECMWSINVDKLWLYASTCHLCRLLTNYLILLAQISDIPPYLTCCTYSVCVKYLWSSTGDSGNTQNILRSKNNLKHCLGSYTLDPSFINL